jgi:hypothetical protein
MEYTEIPTGKPHSNPRMAAYRQRMKDRGLKQVQFWTVDTKAPCLMAELREEMQSYHHAEDEAFCEALADAATETWN